MFMFRGRILSGSYLSVYPDLFVLQSLTGSFLHEVLGYLELGQNSSFLGFPDNPGFYLNK